MTRIADHAIDPLSSVVARRGRCRAPLPREELWRLLEAARWAPSSGNQQPWRFVVAEQGTPGFSAIHATLAAGNQPWTTRAAALIVVCAEVVRTTKEGQQPRRLAAFDAGAAWMSLALQGSQMGLVVHAMEGFDHVSCKAAVHAPADVDVLAVVAVGLPGDPALLTEEWQRKSDEAPNLRFPIDERVAFGRFD